MSLTEIAKVQVEIEEATRFFHSTTIHNVHIRAEPEDLLAVTNVYPIATDATNSEPESRVMVLYTGGTIGMKCKDGVYIPEINYLPNAIKKLPHINDQEYVEKFYSSAKVRPYVLPPVKNEDKRVIYWIFEYEPLLDSSDMTFDDWIRIATDIKNNYEKYDGFVVLHGTDTLCYTASAVSFMFENLGKPVIFTGSQIPIAEVRSDGQENFIGAVIVAGNYDIPEVCIYFNNKLFRGNRCSKLDNSSLDAFSSPNMHPLASMEIAIAVDWQSVFRSSVPERVSLHTTLSRNVGLLRIFPSITLEYVKVSLQEPVEGVVLQTYGSGNIPSQRRDILAEIKKAVDRGVIVVNCSQCVRGCINKEYATGKILYDVGVTSGCDMTVEAALCKLAYVLGHKDWDIVKKRKMMQTNLRGELTRASMDKSGISTLKDLEFVREFAKFLRISSSVEMTVLRDALYPPLICSAASNGDLDLLDKLHKTGANLGAADYDNRTAMHVAASSGQLDAVKYLLERGVSVHHKDRWGDTPYLGAIRNRHYGVIELIKAAGGHLTLSSVSIGIELCSLASKNDLSTLKAWRLAGADMNSADYDSRTAMHIAASRGHVEIIRFLLDNSGDPRVKDTFGNTPFDEAKNRAQTQVAEILALFTLVPNAP